MIRTDQKTAKLADQTKASKHGEAPSKGPKDKAGNKNEEKGTGVVKDTKNLRYDTSRLMSFGSLESRYGVKKEVARGGYGVVYLAESLQDSSDRVAIKVFLQNHRLYYPLQEILYMRLLSGHSSFPSFREVAIHNNFVMVVMDWVEGEPFKQLMRDYDPLEYMKYMESLSLALATVHSYGIVHHDVKPSNFVYSKSRGKGVLIDFGTMILVNCISYRMSLNIIVLIRAISLEA